VCRRRAGDSGAARFASKKSRMALSMACRTSGRPGGFAEPDAAAPSPQGVRIANLFRNRLFQVLLGCLAAAGLLALAWRYTPLREVITLDNVVAFVRSSSGKWWAPLALALAYTPASVVMFPRPLLTLAAAIAFGPWQGLAIAMSGIVVNTLVGYSLGRTMDEKRVRRWGGPKFARVGKMLKKEGLVAVATVGLLPVAPFSVETLAF